MGSGWIGGDVGDGGDGVTVGEEVGDSVGVVVGEGLPESVGLPVGVGLVDGLGLPEVGDAVVGVVGSGSVGSVGSMVGNCCGCGVSDSGPVSANNVPIASPATANTAISPRTRPAVVGGGGAPSAPGESPGVGGSGSVGIWPG